MKKITHNNWIEGEKYKKRILIEDFDKKINLIEDVIVSPGKNVPVHSHDHTDEIFYIIAGSAIMTVDNEEFPVSPGDTIYIEKNENHGFLNHSQDELKMMVLKIGYIKGDSFLG